MIRESVIFFDGLCNLCNGAVQFVIRRDSHHHFKFASLQSDFAQQTLSQFHIEPKQGDSFVLLMNGKIYERSTAALQVAKKLNGLWPMLYGFIIIPKLIRDAVYNFVAKHRYKWFGKQESCWVPTPELRDRFID